MQVLFAAIILLGGISLTDGRPASAALMAGAPDDLDMTPPTGFMLQAYCGEVCRGEWRHHRHDGLEHRHHRWRDYERDPAGR